MVSGTNMKHGVYTVQTYTDKALALYNSQT